ncbi:carboxypeptidase-like regulatory domain-containing protein [Haliovirga abyssi]|uniref:SbsA Ig-like domain-containing protein n=1 Tax=Haliovirga abyssi TaxID=2996794 RepID=A0AAU9DBH5_9FUSO|nr:carboxypeptidase-like regulatory domain-containing protein [Haliovirga abyssi]BDU49592.1 hypothetical protein HLVA_01610 [Haliovirga abyssi]
MKKILTLAVALLALSFAGCFTDKTTTEDNTTKQETTTTVTTEGKIVNTASPKGIFAGVVRDSFNNPLEAVTVSIGGKSIVTDKTGTFKIEGLDVGGAGAGKEVSYTAVFSKKNYLSITKSIVFKEDTLTNDDTNATIHIDATTGTSVNSGEDGLIVGTVVIPLNNATATVDAEMVELVTAKGTISLPETLSTTAAIKVIPYISGSSVPMSDYSQEISDSLEYTIKNIPAQETSVTLKIYINGNIYASYYVNEEAVNFHTAKRIDSKVQGGQREVIQNFSAKKYGEVSGIVYKNYKLANATDNTVGAGAKVELYRDVYPSPVKMGEAFTNAAGKYIIHEILPGVYSLKLLDFDKENDGEFDFVNGKTFMDIAVAEGDNVTNGVSPYSIVKDLWFTGYQNYSVSGKVEAGIEGNIIANVNVKVYYSSTNKLLKETRTTTTGAFSVSGIQFKNIKIVAEAIDTDNNLINNFNQATKDITNNEGIDVNDVYLFMAPNSDEYGLHVVSTNFTMKKTVSGETKLLTKVNGVEPNGTVVLTFDNAVSTDSENEILAKLDKVVKLIGSSDVDIDYSFDSTRKIMTITPKKPLTGNLYTVWINSELATSNGYKYSVANTINTDLLNSTNVDIDVEAYQLKVAGASFLTKDEYGNWSANDVEGQDANTAIAITFNKEISQSKITELVNKGENIVTVTDMATLKDILTDYTFDTANKIMTISPKVSLTPGNQYRITLNSELKAKSASDNGLDIKINGDKVFTGKIYKANNESLTSIKPEIFIDGAYVDNYTASNFAMDWNFGNAGIYKTTDLDETVQTYGASSFDVKFSVSGLESKKANIKEFDIYAKTESSYWEKLSAININAITKTEWKLGVKKTTVNLNNVNGLDSSDKLKWGESLEIIVIPVDAKGKPADFPTTEDATKVLTLKDNYGVKLAGLNGTSLLNAGTNTLTMSEDIYPAGYGVTITGINSNIGINTTTAGAVSNLRIGSSLNELKFEAYPTSKFVVGADYNHGESDPANRLTLVSSNGLYDGMKLETTDGEIVVSNIVNGTTIDFSYVATPFDMAKDVEFTISKDNTDIYSRADSTKVYNITGTGYGEIHEIAVSAYADGGDGDYTNGGIVTLSGTNPLLGVTSGMVLSLHDNNGVVTTNINVTVTNVGTNGNDKQFSTSSSIEGLTTGGTSFVVTNIYQLTGVTSVNSLIIGEKLYLEHATDGTSKEVTIMAVDNLNNIVKISASPENYTKSFKLKTVDTTAKTFIAKEVKKYAVGDKVVINKDTSSIIATGTNIMTNITGISPVETVGGTKLYKYTTTDDITGAAENQTIDFVSNVQLKVVAKDSSENMIQADDDTLRYDEAKGWIID